MTKSFPLKTLLKHGVIRAGGSDSPGYWPVDPLRDISACVSRKMRGCEVWVPEERLTPQEAFAMHTTTAAFASVEENQKGTLEVGKFADIAVMQEDPFDVEPERIKDLKVQMTIVGGRSSTGIRERFGNKLDSHSICPLLGHVSYRARKSISTAN